MEPTTLLARAGTLAARAVLTMVCALGASATVSAAPPTADFFNPDAYADMRLAPSGKRLATTVPASNGRRSLAIVDLADASKTKIIAAYADADIWGVQWVSDERLVYRLMDQREPLRKQRGVGLFSIDAEGKEAPRMLIQPSWNFISTKGSNINTRSLQPNYDLYKVLRDGTDDVLVGQVVFTGTGEVTNVNLARLNTRDGTLRNLSTGAPEHAFAWTVDRKGEPRLLVTEHQGTEALYWKAGESAPWVKLYEAASLAGGVVAPLYVESDKRVFAAARVAPDTDVASLVVMDLSGATAGTKPPAEALLTTPGFDFEGRVIRARSGQIIGASYMTEAAGTVWFDPAMKKLQDQVDKLLPNSNNVLDCGDCENPENVLVVSSSDRLPLAYRLFRVGKGTLEPIASSRPAIKPQEMASSDMVRVPMRDGLSIPVYVTQPNGPKAPKPTVVLVHGGPWVRGASWMWRPEAQFLASRGYAVIEPEFRGSTGYGRKLFRAGWKQWGLAMQDDVADAALWAVKQGYADPKRICIAGASYGGYATLMGLIRNPEIFRCGVEWVGVTDIDLMYSISWSDLSDQFQRYGMPEMVGDRQKDAAQLAATSPIKLASKITQPLFMAYGGEDRRVPMDHGTQMRDAIGKTNRNVEWKVYADEGHGWLLPANQIDFWNRVEVFLDKNLKNAAP